MRDLYFFMCFFFNKSGKYLVVFLSRVSYCLECTPVSLFLQLRFKPSMFHKPHKGLMLAPLTPEPSGFDYICSLSYEIFFLKICKGGGKNIYVIKSKLFFFKLT